MIHSLSVGFQRVVSRAVRFNVETIDFEIVAVAGDTGPVLDFFCENEDGNPIDVSTAAVTVSIRRANAALSDSFEPATPVTGACVVIDGPAGHVRYMFGASDIAVPGTYFADLTINDGVTKETAPSPIRLIVRPNNQ